MRKLFPTLQDLENKSTAYFKQYKQRSPRHYRVFLGVSKHMLSTWQKTQPDYFNHIKLMEDMILADLEKAIAYGNNKSVIGKMFILKAYDHELYAPESRQIQQQEPMQIIVDGENTSGKKLQIGVIENEPKESGKDN